METIILEILNELRSANSVSDERLAKIIRKQNRSVADNRQHFSKKKLLPYYLKVKETEPLRWASWNIIPQTEAQLLRLLQVKPRRSASGVATISVITKPWACSNNCLYCPNDLRMPKSYLSDEPACQRAERNYFDPYLQVLSRLQALTHMGHATDKIELIILGGNWSDYPKEYQIWFVSELFRALNEGLAAEREARERRDMYRKRGLSNRSEDLASFVAKLQQEVNSGCLSFNQAVTQLYESRDPWKSIAHEQTADTATLMRQQELNEIAKHRVVGLVVETHPNAITSESLALIRLLGCTKVQIGIQSLDPDVLALNNRSADLIKIQESFNLLRIFGFKIHVHIMFNLYGSTNDKDKLGYARLVSELPYQPDEVKLYPCVLVESAALNEHYAKKSWRPYSHAELLDVLTHATLNTPEFTRISRMIRDISACDIIAGNKKANVRQMVESELEGAGKEIQEIRYREIRTKGVELESLTLKTTMYETSNTNEYFLQWVTPQNRIAGFLRLSLPKTDYFSTQLDTLPVLPFEAMIREVHVYGRVAKLNQTATDSTASATQHLGLGRQLIEAAETIAKQQGYRKLNAISSVGTREYYRSLNFADNGLYQQKALG